MQYTLGNTTEALQSTSIRYMPTKIKKGHSILHTFTLS
uniref:Uncharacterized protein n=1 Tax=Rhizophora mucronata TaxID=61149 RepID=A0A2P2Q8N7_RHIMU